MAVKKLSENQVKTYLEMIVEHGEEGLYRRAIGMGIMRYASNVKHPEVELLDLSEAFFIAYRRGEEEILFSIGKALRRAAHTLYRKLVKDDNKEINNRFLNVVR
ncbi:MAG TPA: hypothetical protein VI423_05790 [Paenisporosarcina sp.]|nr:hypothetical protein [Paenisporosarcina sp.]